MATKKSSNTSTTNKSSNRRTKPLMAKAGYTATRRRYPNGGKVCK